MKIRLLFLLLFIVVAIIGYSLMSSDRWNEPHYYYYAEDIIVTDEEYCEIANYIIGNGIRSPEWVKDRLKIIDICGIKYLSFQISTGDNSVFPYGEQEIDMSKDNIAVLWVEGIFMVIGTLGILIFSVSALFYYFDWD